VTPEPGPRPRLWLVTVLVALVIIYGSLYPFEFRIPLSGLGPVGAFLASIGQRPGRGDTLANILLYMPLGFSLSLCFRRGQRRSGTFILVISIGSLMSLSVELAQYYIPGRVTSFNDLATNTLGMVLGSFAASVVGAGFRMPFIDDVAARPAPALLVLAWLAYRLYPYVPTIDLHKYWNALKPIVLTPSLTGYELCRQTATWLTVYALLEAIVRRRRSAVSRPRYSRSSCCAPRC
jgi:VanZ family protein